MKLAFTFFFLFYFPGFFAFSLFLVAQADPAAVAPRGSRKIPDPYRSNKRADTPSSSIVNSHLAYTPSAGGGSLSTTGSVATQKEKGPPPDLSSLLGALGGGQDGSGQRGAATPGDGSNQVGGDPAINNAPANQPYNATDSSSDPNFGPPVNGTDFSSAKCGKTQATWVTHYGSDPTKYANAAEERMEGGPLDRHGGRLNSVEESIQNGRPVSVAGDIHGEFGRRCNQSPKKACLILLCYKNFDQVFPEYRARFPGVQKDCLIGVVVDTGGAFYGTNGRKIDVATRSIEKARKISGGGRYYEIETDDCNASRDDKRKCEVNNVTAACLADGTGAVNKSNSGGGVQ